MTDLRESVARVAAFLNWWGNDPIVRQDKAELHASDLLTILDALDGLGIPEVEEPDDSVTEQAEWKDYDRDC